MKELKFIHITKCAGTYIEEAGKKNNIAWGKYHKEYGWHHNYLITRSEELKNKYDWFMIVRNPYDRILSEYYCRWGVPNRIKKDVKTVEDFNKCLISKINRRTPRNIRDYRPGFHFCEQYKYLDPNIPIHIIKFENMHQGLSELFAKYNLNIVLLKKKINSRNDHNAQKLFSIKDFSPELIRLINKVYDKDFKLFGYEKM